MSGRPFTEVVKMPGHKYFHNCGQPTKFDLEAQVSLVPSHLILFLLRVMPMRATVGKCSIFIPFHGLDHEDAS